MTEALKQLTEEYSEALRQYLEGAGEAALQRAYEIGRQALADGLGILELAAAHHGALEEILGPGVVEMAGGFLAESLSPFEMTHRGFRESVDSLRRRAADLAESEEKFRVLAETAQDAIVTADVLGRLTFLNPAAERTFGYPPGEALAVPLRALLPEEPVPGRTLELIGRRKDGSEFPAEVSLARWTARGESWFTAVIRDITARRQAEEERSRLTAQLLQGQKLQAIGQLAAGVAHEINNPVSYILANSAALGERFSDIERYIRALESAVEELAAGEKAAPIRAELEHLRQTLDSEFLLRDFRDAIRDTHEGAVRIREIVRGLREFTYADRGEMESADLHEVLESTIRVCWNEIRYKAELHRDYGTIPRVFCNPHQLNQVFMNLLVNAAQAIPEKGEIFVSTRRKESDVFVRIRDTGVGISRENLAQIFEPFFTTKPKGKGIGLGLHVAYKIVKAHGGEIQVVSEVGKGSEFTVRLPIRSPR